VAVTGELAEDTVLRVGAATDPKSLANAIFRAIFDAHQYPRVRAIGHGAVGQATKAIAIASGLTATRGMNLASIIGFETIINGEGEEITAQVFVLFERK
jgi:stage V sporulation protein S